MHVFCIDYCKLNAFSLVDLCLLTFVKSLIGDCVHFSRIAYCTFDLRGDGRFHITDVVANGDAVLRCITAEPDPSQGDLCAPIEGACIREHVGHFEFVHNICDRVYSESRNINTGNMLVTLSSYTMSAIEFILKVEI